jgi:hypothetical protein
LCVVDALHVEVVLRARTVLDFFVVAIFSEVASGGEAEDERALGKRRAAASEYHEKSDYR